MKIMELVKPKKPRTVIVLNEGQVRRLLNNITSQKSKKKPL